MRGATLVAWDEDDAQPTQQNAAREDERERRKRQLRACNLVEGGDPARGRDARGVVLVTADYGEPLPAIEAARLALARARVGLAAIGAPCQEVNLSLEGAEEAARYNPRDLLLFPTFFVRAPEGLFEYRGGASPSDLCAAAARFVWVQEDAPRYDICSP
jgi:hypothetical protein